MTNSANYRVPGVGASLRAGSPGNVAAAVQQLPPPEGAEDACGCGHPGAHHDAVALRYCAATTTGSMARGCVCSE